jgi:hypothetical protein
MLLHFFTERMLKELMADAAEPELHFSRCSPRYTVV